MFVALIVVLNCSVRNIAQSRDSRSMTAGSSVSSDTDHVANETVLESEALTIRHLTINPGCTGYHYKHPGGSIILLREYAYQIAIPLSDEQLQSQLRVGDVIRIEPGDYVLENHDAKPLEFLSIEMKRSVLSVNPGEGPQPSIPAGIHLIRKVR